MVETISNVVLLSFRLIAKIFLKEPEVPEIPEPTSINWNVVAFGTALAGVTILTAVGLGYLLIQNRAEIIRTGAECERLRESEEVIGLARKLVQQDSELWDQLTKLPSNLGSFSSSCSSYLADKYARCEGYVVKEYKDGQCSSDVCKLARAGIMSYKEFSDWTQAWARAETTCHPLGIFKGTHLENVTIGRRFVWDGMSVIVEGYL